MIVAITAYDTEDTLKKCSDAGIKDCLSKPIKPDQLDFILEYHKKQQSASELSFAGSMLKLDQVN